MCKPTSINYGFDPGYLMGEALCLLDRTVWWECGAITYSRDGEKRHRWAHWRYWWRRLLHG